jgi:hypothetical protein
MIKTGWRSGLMASQDGDFLQDVDKAQNQSDAPECLTL